MCELYDMNKLYLKVFKKNKYNKKDYDYWNEKDFNCMSVYTLFYWND